jgi:hypothetical protein
MEMDIGWEIHNTERLSNTIQGTTQEVSHRADLRAKAEPKCRIFAWILLQHKILTANNLAK